MSEHCVICGNCLVDGELVYRLSLVTFGDPKTAESVDGWVCLECISLPDN